MGSFLLSICEIFVPLLWQELLFHLVQHCSANELFKNTGFPSPFGEGQQKVERFSVSALNSKRRKEGMEICYLL